MGGIHAPPEVRFWRSVDRDPVGCWEWKLMRMVPYEYGKFNAGNGVDGNMVLAHRYAYRDAIGPIPDGIEVCHTCDNPPCVRPSHLFLGTHQENIHDGVDKGRIPSKLNWFLVQSIRGSTESHSFLARFFGVNTEVIRRIRMNTKWHDPNYIVKPSHFPGRGCRRK